MALDVLQDLDFKGVSRLVNIPDATDAQHPVSKRQFDAAIEGTNWKDNARVSTQGNISISSPGATIDGITMVSGDRVLVRAQTSGAENGIYLWNGAAIPMTRAPDANTADELENAVIIVDEGTSAGASFRQTVVNFTIGTTALIWSSFLAAAPPASDTAAGIVELATQSEVDAGTATNLAVTPATLAGSKFARKSASTTFGDGTATQYDIVHNLNSLDVQTTVRRTTGNKDKILCEDRVVDANTIRLVFSAAPTTNSMRVTVGL